MRITLEDISPASLQAIIESFVLREGTDYGEQEANLAGKCAQVKLQLEREQAEIWFDPETGTVDIRVVPPA